MSTTSTDSVILEFDSAIFNLTAVLKAAYWFTDRCFVDVQQGPRRSQEAIEVRLRPKRADQDMQVLTGEFSNAVLDQELQHRIAVESAATRKLIIAHALSKTPLINAELEVADPLKDPLEVARADAENTARA